MALSIMDEDFVNADNAAFLHGLTEEQWLAFLDRWVTRTPPDPVRFADGTYYCDDGQEVNRRMFWWFHTDNTICKHGERSESV